MPIYTKTLILETKKAGDGNRTHVSSLEGWCSTIELHPHITYSIKAECPEPESNQRHRDFQSLALPTELSGLVILLLPFLSTKVILSCIYFNVNWFFEICIEKGPETRTFAHFISEYMPILPSLSMYLPSW